MIELQGTEETFHLNLSSQYNFNKTSANQIVQDRFH